MPGPVPGIHVFPNVRLYVDGRDKPGHDALGWYLILYSRLGLWVPALRSLGARLAGTTTGRNFANRSRGEIEFGGDGRVGVEVIDDGHASR